MRVDTRNHWTNRLLRTAALCLVFSSTAVCLAKAKPVIITVSATGNAEFPTVQQAVDHAPDSGAVILIAAGTYKERVRVAKPHVVLVGMGAGPADVVITAGESAKSTGSTFSSGTVVVDADGFEAENLTIANTWWDEHPDPHDASQAVALQLSSDKAVLDRVRILSGQDTVFATSRRCQSGALASCEGTRQFFNDCFVEGNVDYIFGDSEAVFSHCELHSRPHGNIMITAQSKNSPQQQSGYYFLSCKITGEDNGNKVFFGRPWRDYATVTFYDTDIEQKIAPQGWAEWDGRLKTATYREYKSHGPGVNDGHRSVVYPPLDAEAEAHLTPEWLLRGADAWNPMADVAQLRHYAQAPTSAAKAR